MHNDVLERIHQVLRNLVRNFNISKKYVDEDDPWTGILAAASFVIFSTTNSKNVYSPGQLIFVCDMIFPTKHKVDWKLIRHRNQA